MIFLDELTTGLDPAKREDDVEAVVRRLVTDGSIVAADHPSTCDEGRRAGDEITDRSWLCRCHRP